MSPSLKWLCFRDSAWRWFSSSINLTTSTLSIHHPQPTLRWHTIRGCVQGTDWLIHVSMAWGQMRRNLRRKIQKENNFLLLGVHILVIDWLNLEKSEEKAIKMVYVGVYGGYGPVFWSHKIYLCEQQIELQVARTWELDQSTLWTNNSK